MPEQVPEADLGDQQEVTLHFSLPCESCLGCDYAAAAAIALLQRLELGVDAQIYVAKALSWWPYPTVERLSDVADAHSVEAQRNRPLDKGGRSCLRP